METKYTKSDNLKQILMDQRILESGKWKLLAASSTLAAFLA
jgi:hypothetical protein